MVVVVVAAIVFMLRCCAFVFLFSVVAGPFFFFFFKQYLFFSVWSRYGCTIVIDDVDRNVCQKSSLRQVINLSALHR